MTKGDGVSFTLRFLRFSEVNSAVKAVTLFRCCYTETGEAMPHPPKVFMSTQYVRNLTVAESAGEFLTFTLSSWTPGPPRSPGPALP